MKIILATTHNETLTLAKTTLEKLGHTVITVSNSNDVIDKFRFDAPDIIMLDIQLEDSNGYACAKRIREVSLGSWIPIIFITPTHDPETIKKIILSGGDDYLEAPLDNLILTAKMQILQRLAAMRETIEENARKFNVLSSIDVLTGVYNRVQLDKYIKEKIVQANLHNTRFAILSIDLDHFKTINDNLGHHIGDLLLKNVAKRLRTCLRLDDFVARIGSDEFIIVLDNLENSEVPEHIAQLIINALIPPHALLNEDVHISCSIGIVYYPEDGKDAETLIQNADSAMYYAKECGRNNFQVFTQVLYEKRKNQVNLEDSLKFAVDREELVLTYQPIYDLKTRNIVGMEALIYWQHPKLGLISPNIFIPLAEDNGLIDAIGKWTFRNAFAQAAKWYLAGLTDFHLAINISPRHLLQKNLPQLLLEMMQKTQTPPNILELELTETAVLTHTHDAVDIINKIEALGVGIALDDFGTGYSSLSHLKNLPINTIKIDKVFVDNMTTAHKDAMMVKSIIAMGKNLNLNVIAEGIETEAQLEMLVANECPQGQGFYLSKPLTAEQMTIVLREQHAKKN